MKTECSNREAKELLRNFIDEELAGKIERLKDFDFFELKKSKIYGCPGRFFDCDDTNLSRAIYELVWGDSFRDLTYSNQGKGRPYRGDTMNSFHTLFGRSIPELPRCFFGVEKHQPTDEFRQKVELFHHRYHTIGNFVILPNLTTIDDTINLYRGVHPAWRDYFDHFLMGLALCLTDAPDRDCGLSKLIQDNEFFFQKYHSEDGFRRLARILLLEDYLDSNGHPKELFRVYWHWKKESASGEYCKVAEHYLATTESIIHNRADKIIAILKSKLAGNSLCSGKL